MRTAVTALRGYLPPLLVHLLIGVPAALAVLCARWYIAYGHCEYDDLGRRDLDGCTYDQIENNGFALIALIWIGALVLLLLLLFDVLRPLYAGRPLKPRLLTLPAVLVPYAVYVTNGGW
ncbi:hypothetical protein CLM62_20980 [Streptomyces sp. SA15]|uniref:hypothetical protein n=1 Tax=Streptomyces sp. SA15 TaxID=934019 RepID=UPI000BAE72D5|nr:hypothetical protein [Streptomyces sp. SA15]PAZ13960.1 hypothetical protein CLM62_20980 [Streptomyces sp. SA15]